MSNSFRNSQKYVYATTPRPFTEFIQCDNSYITHKYVNSLQFDSCKNFAANLNITGFEKVFKALHICQENTQSRFLIVIVLVNIKKENNQEKKNMQEKTNQAKRHKTHWKHLVSLPGIESGASGVVLQCTNHYANHAIIILIYKLRYMHITSTIQQHSYFSKKGATLSKKIAVKSQ